MTSMLTKSNKKLIVHRDSLSLKILKGVAIGGLILVAATSPYFGFQVIKEVIHRHRNKKWRTFYRSIQYLSKRGFVRILGETKDGQIKVQITKEGKEIVKICEVNELKLDKSKIWDGQWRIVIFDVPVSKNKARLAFAEQLKRLGFMMVQKSVWICPYECEEQVYVLRKFYNIENMVTIVRSNDTEDEHEWRRGFNLKEFREATVKLT